MFLTINNSYARKTYHEKVGLYEAYGGVEELNNDGY